MSCGWRWRSRSGSALTLATVPLAIRLAWRTNFLDRPVGYKKHGRPRRTSVGSA